MSRDWTPRELYTVEQHNIRNGRGDLWDFMKGATWHINGESFALCTEQQISQRQKYPLLGRLYEGYDKLYAFLSQIPDGLSLLARHESELDAYIRTGEGDRESPLLRWFDGELDEHFYYREANDALLMEFIKDEAAHLHVREAEAETRKPSLTEQISGADSRSSASSHAPSCGHITPERL